MIYRIQVGWKKHINVTVKPTNPPTQGQPNPRKARLKVACGPLFFPCSKIFFWWVGIDFVSETDYKKPNLTKFSANFGSFSEKIGSLKTTLNIQTVWMFSLGTEWCSLYLT